MQPTVNVVSGKICGIHRDGVDVFLGVPYAAAPVGDLRFQLPVPHPKWDAIRDVSQPGPTAPQNKRAVFPKVNISPLVGDGWQQGDDFLTANIWTPDATAAGLPVLVFIHGGAWAAGTNNATVSDGTKFAQSGNVCVSVNYRLGIEGFLPIPGVPTNLGLRDLLAALAWIQENITAFGGDPEKVTVFGESAGAMLIGALMGSPLSKGLFHRAIMQSGHASMVRSPEVALRVVKLVAKLLRITPDAEGFKSKSIDECLKALATISLPKTRINLKDSSGRDRVLGMSKVTPIFGDDVLPEPPLQALSKGMNSDVLCIAGTNRDEMNLYFVPTGIRKSIRGLLALFVLSRSQPSAFSMLRRYGLWHKGIRPGDALSEALTDLAFRLPARQFATAHKGSTHIYEFGWRSPACEGELAACHGLELPFVFDTLGSCSGPDGILGEHAPASLARSIHDLWVAIARGAEVPWPQYRLPTRNVYSLETGTWKSEEALPAEHYDALPY